MELCGLVGRVRATSDDISLCSCLVSRKFGAVHSRQGTGRLLWWVPAKHKTAVMMVSGSCIFQQPSLSHNHFHYPHRAGCCWTFQSEFCSQQNRHFVCFFVFLLKTNAAHEEYTGPCLLKTASSACPVCTEIKKAQSREAICRFVTFKTAQVEVFVISLLQPDTREKRHC